MSPTPQELSEAARSGSIVIDGLYIHIPFCLHKCHYCDFYSIVDGNGHADSDRQAPFTESLLGELAAQAKIPATPTSPSFHPKTLFVGGGTPTLLAERHWKDLLRALRCTGVLDEVVEFSVEANPETVEEQLIRTLRDGGVNRLSIGGQSFNTEVLRTLERRHDPRSVQKAMATARRCGIDNLNIDLIFGTPGQTLPMFQEDVERTLDLSPAHIACYNLTYETGTALTQRLQNGLITRTSERLEHAMYEWLIDRMQLAGFEHYEISNWAATRRTTACHDAAVNPDRRCMHNLIYWRNGNWIGAGPSAASHIDGHRWKNIPHLSRYLATAPQPERIDEETVPPARRVGEAMMLGLRLRDGMPLSWLHENLEAQDQRWQVIADLESRGLVEQVKACLRLTRDGLWVSDAIFTQLL